MGVLNKNNFEVSSYTNTSGNKSLIGQFTVPRGKVFSFFSGKKFGLFLPVEQTFSLEAEVDRASYQATVTLPIADNPNKSDSQEIYATWKGSAAAVTAVSRSTKKITVTVDATEGDLVIYYLPKSGDLEILIEAPKGMRRQAEMYVNELALVHELDQVKTKALAPADNMHAAERFRVSIYATVSGTVNAEKQNGQISIPFKSMTESAWLRALASRPTISPAARQSILSSTATEVILNSWSQGGL